MSHYYQDNQLDVDITKEKLAQTITDAIDLKAYSCEIIKQKENLILRIWYREGFVEKEKPDTVSAEKLGGYIQKALNEQNFTSCEVRDLVNGGLNITAWPSSPYDIANATRL